MSVKTAQSDSVRSQIAVLSERFDRFAAEQMACWEKVQALLQKSCMAPEVNLEVEEARFLKANDLFGGLPDEELATFLSAGRRVMFGPGEWVFRHGDPCNCVLAICSGVLEIRRDGEGDSGTVALLGAGEVLGMLGVLTGGAHRSSGRFPEGGEVFVLESQEFDRVIEQLPRLSAALTRSLARRLMGAVQKGDMSRARRRQLEGSLAHFDLATVLQSLFATDACAGCLRILDQEGTPCGEILVGEGRVVGCTAGELSGREAFQTLFLADNSDRRFVFEEKDVHGDEKTGSLAGMSGAGLLMDCLRIADEVARVKSGPLGDAGRILRRRRKPQEWDEPETRELLRRIWRLLEKEPSVTDLLSAGLDHEHLVLRVLHRLLEAGCIA